MARKHSTYQYPAGTTTVLGVDASLTNTGVVLVNISPTPESRVQLFRDAAHALATCPPKAEVIRSEVAESSSSEPMTWRLGQIYDLVLELLAYDGENPATLLALEGLAWARHAAPQLAMAHGAVHAALNTHRNQGNGCSFVQVAPNVTKIVACPDWPGLSHANWLAAKKRGPYTRSSPDKEDVMRGVGRRYGFATLNEHKADALCVALAGWAGAGTRI